MKMIRDLGTRRELNKGRKLVRWAIYECPICKTNFECRVATIKSGG